ncbi:hypothetical protein C2G38_2174005 [Gigaspora rosea]|uniref:Uncharacterized protein n=1 Tax=Gigaspora rosea TaxID=44941 RepID=A0A397VM89_9GLOM|nr:hypothetical protein C2G38_2174005 [Gigaspora rosea]
MKINNEARQLKVKNSKLFFQYACTETSLAKYKAEYYAKSEEVKSLQSVINSFPLGYFDKNNQPDGSERTDLYVKSGGEKNNEPESSSTSSEQIIPTISKEKISLVIVKKLWNLESIIQKEKVEYPAHKKYINREEVLDRPEITPKYLPWIY